MFGIKSKKDKKIQELQEKIERLEGNLVPSNRMFRESYDIKELSAVFYVPFDEVKYIPDGYVQQALVNQLANSLANSLEEIITVSENTDYDKCRKVYRGTLNVCIGGGNK